MFLTTSASGGVGTDGADTVKDLITNGDIAEGTSVANTQNALLACRNVSVLNLGAVTVWFSPDGVHYTPVPASTERQFLNLPNISRACLRDYSAGATSSVYVTLWG